mgnify:CR=1 FL=1|jgi:hypothetical protein
MRVDWYTRGVLTVIAASLVMLVMQNMELIPAATADEKPARPSASPSTVRVPVNEDGSVDVRLKGGLSDKIMDVNIVRVSGTETQEGVPVRPFGHSMNVNIEEMGGYQVYRSLPVQMN